MLKLVFISSPYSGDIEINTIRARGYSRFAIDKGYVPLAPHLLFPQFMNEESERDLAIKFNRILLERCDEMWIFGNTLSQGMREEFKKATNINIPIRYFSEELKEV